jgi:asparagine synthase (glutamine-hydrolysing)
MCGVSAVIHLRRAPLLRPSATVDVMNRLQAHRGPDGKGTWIHEREVAALGHRRLSVIALGDEGRQPMKHASGDVVTFNGEIYNYKELREELGAERFTTSSDTEVILHAWRAWGPQCVQKLRGMFAFVLWDAEREVLFCARDPFGIKPLYYTIVDDVAYVASEMKALLPFVTSIDTDVDALKDYLSFQFVLDGKTLFKGIRELPAGHTLELGGSASPRPRRYWEVYFQPDLDHTEHYFVTRGRALLEESIALHLRSDVPVGAYVSGGLDSSLIAAVAARQQPGTLLGFHGRFDLGADYDESAHATAVAQSSGIDLHVGTFTDADFVRHIEDIVYHLDTPVAGPGSFPQYMVSALAAKHRKVLLGGQGGDEIFGGYVRYLVAYFEQCIKAAIDGTMNNGQFVVTYESIIPNLGALRRYKSMLQGFWKDGLFEEMDKRYFKLINRAPDLGDEVNWSELGAYSPYETFRSIFFGDNVRHESYFDRMTHFDFKTLLPALLHVEDRMSMAHGLESRVPLLDTPLVEWAAQIPAIVKFTGGTLKRVEKLIAEPWLDKAIVHREDKMGFPVPLVDWLKQAGPVREMVLDVFGSSAARGRTFVNADAVVKKLDRESKFGRQLWGLLSLELWQRRFHDRASELRKMREGAA